MSDPVASTSTHLPTPPSPPPPSASRSARGRSSGSESSTKYGAITHTKQGSARQALLAATPDPAAPSPSSSWLKPSRRLSGANSHPRQPSRTRFARSRERSGQDEQDVFESDLSSSDDDAGGDDGRAGGRRFSRTRAASNAGSIWSRITVGRDDDEESLVEESDKQWGVLQMELIQRIRGKRGLIGIYFGVYLLSILLSLESNLSPTIEPYFLSLLNSHSLLASLAIVTSLAHAVGKPPITKILDVFGRAQGVAVAASFWAVGYALTASAQTARMYIFGRAFAALGATGLGLAQQIVVADTSSLANRALFTSTISLPWLFTTWIGPPIGAWFQRRGEAGYRSAYAVFGVLVPLGAAVLCSALIHDWRRTERALKAAGLDTPHPPHHSSRHSRYLSAAARRSGSGSGAHHGHHPTGKLSRASRVSMVSQAESEHRATTEGAQNWKDKLRRVWDELDVVGLAAMTVGCLLLLLPLTLAARKPTKLEEIDTWVMMAVGFVVLVGFGFYEWSFAPVPMLPPRLFMNRTILAGAVLGFFHFASCFAYSSFFTSFLQVAREASPRDASYISESYIFAASLAAPVVGLLARQTKHYKWLVVSGVVVHVLGVLLMMRARRLDAPTWEIVLSQVLGGIGGAGTTLAGQLGCQAVVGTQDVGIATAIFLTVTTLGGAFGAAFAGSVWSADLPVRLYANLPDAAKGEVAAIMESLPYALSFAPGSPTRLAINASYVEVQQKLNALAVVLLVPALVAALMMRNVNLEVEERRRQEGVVLLGSAEFEDETDVSESSSLLSSRA